MATSDYLESMNDVRLKPKLLRSLIRNSVPDEKRPFPSPPELSAVLSYVKNHGLLSESLGGSPADAKRMESWKTAVDAWVDHSLSLVSSKSPDKCWAGICFLGVTVEKCSSDRFLASYSVWFQKLLSKIQPPSDSHFVKVATCASLSDLFTRLALVPSVKKDAVSIAGKVIQPALQLLTEGGTDDVWVGAIDLLCTLIKSFPSSIHRHYERVSAIVISKIMSGECSVKMSKVTIPVRPLLALVGRVLMVDGSLCESLSPITTAMHQELLCSELPTLHLNSLDLLIAVIKGVGGLLLPHAANVVRLITEFFRKATVPDVRIKVYTVVQILLISMGVGMAQYLSQEVINNAFTDLDFRSHASASGFSNLQSPKATSEVLQRCSHRKRKHASGPSEERQNGVNFEVDNVNRNAKVCVQIAALGALEALIIVGGSLKPECWRSDVDLLLITVATIACDAGWVKEENSDIMTEDSSSTEGNFQLAALNALLASILSPSHVRPPYLSQGLELFRKGKQVTGTKIAALCARALLSLEVLIHPRALPMVDSPASKSYNSDNGFSHHLPESIFPNPSVLPFAMGSCVAPFAMGSRGNNLDLDDDLYNSWLGDGDEIEVHVNNREKPMDEIEVDVSNREKPMYEIEVDVNNFADNDMATPGEDTAISGDAIMGSDNTEGKNLRVSTNFPDLNKDVITSTHFYWICFQE